ncbi:DUF5682 family protein [Luteimicrobium subarcticum]|uniref:Uncharacterized protein n=1 Tax=Luteimicrobium subarcticum TaxID=620910 RepID=A0A2M8WRE3_9MICO|nr:DUF5682 family protein [Luteimicrobium subarcticum]PJI93510.1 hypothetical protein CLV34_2084 [Luteimicrobium subarcticum]
MTHRTDDAPAGTGTPPGAGTPPSGEEAPSGEDVRQLAARLVSDALVVVPVRHHSPACARAVRDAFERHRPSRVLVEGPRSFTPLVDLLCHPEAQMPLAVYAWSHPAGGSAGPDERHGGYFPFCDYSPELVALRLARAAGVPAAFCDLEVAEQAAAATARVLPGDGAIVRDDRYTHSRSLDLLSRRLGCRDEDDLWELLVEAGPDDPDAHRAALTAYCLLARHGYTDDELDEDGTRAREAEMVRHVREAVAARAPGDGPVLVVLGGFHAVALPDLLLTADDAPGTPAAAATPPTTASVPRPAELPRPAVGGASGTALVRYAFDRLDRLGGYASGMASPAWHQRVWELREAGATVAAARHEAALDVLLDVASRLRDDRRADPVATPTVGAAHAQAVLLARLRERPAPLRSDVLDAVTSCFVQGDADVDGLRVRHTARAVLTGDRVGRVPPGAGTPPLVRDTLDRLRALRLDVDGAEPRLVALDLYRNVAHRRTSRVLHGLRMLGVPFATHAGGPDFVRGTGLARVQERWEVLWSPATEGRLAELSMLGSTLAEAVDTRYAQMLAQATDDGRQPGAVEAVALLAQALVSGLHDRSRAGVTLVRDAVSAEPSFAAVVQAAGTLGLVLDGREPLDAAAVPGIDALLVAACSRALYLGTALVDQDEPPQDVAAALARLRELVVSHPDLDADGLDRLVALLRDDHPDATVRGAATGVAATRGRLTDDDLARAVSGHLAGTVPAADAVAFVRGLLLTARESAWQASGLVDALDDRLTAWERATFHAALPELRLAFAALTPRETDRVADLVAARHGGERPDVSVRHDVDAATLDDHARVAEAVEAVLARDFLGAWLTGAPAGGDPR